jgi:flagellar FliL protein
MAEAKDNNKLIVILLIVTIVVVVGLAGFFGYFMLFKKNTGTGTASTAPAKQIAEQTVKLDEFITNLADENKRYIKTTISVGFTDKNVAEEITANMSIIRDKVNTKLWSETSIDFTGQGLEKVKKELMDSINSVLGEGKIKHIYFDNIIIQ